MQNTITSIVGTTPYPILGSSPRRKAFMLSPLAGGPPQSGTILGAVFGAGLGQVWTVPANVTNVVDMFVWGSGGNAGAGGVALGGGGGGSASFSTAGPLAVVPGQTFNVNVDANGNQLYSVITNASAVAVAKAESGANGVNDIGGVGGSLAVAVGAQKLHGVAGASATVLAGTGGGGGGAAGAYANGAGSATIAGGVGAGTARYLGYGVGGNGGNGGIVAANGNNGLSPGGGGGGAGSTGAVTGLGSNGLAVIFYTVGIPASVISLSHRDDVAPGVGILNYLSGQTFPTLIADEDVGSIITDEWWIVSSVNGVPVQITEYLYEGTCE